MDSELTAYPSKLSSDSKFATIGEYQKRFIRWIINARISHEARKGHQLQPLSTENNGHPFETDVVTTYHRIRR